MAKIGKASLDKLNELHGLIAQYYIDAIESGEELSSGTLAAINAMLKNNDITVDILESSPTENFTSKLKLLIKDKEEEVA